MVNNRLCITIPQELQQYTKSQEVTEQSERKKIAPDFGVKLVKDEQGNLKFAAYYSDLGELVKKIYYEGSSVSVIEHYRNNILYSQETYTEGKVTQNSKYNRLGEPVCTVLYVYDKKGQITSINKSTEGVSYEIEYGYDELMRVNSRIIKVDSKVVAEQTYRYDILDRVVHYRDMNQIIKVNKVNPNNELISYTITDNAGNVIQIANKFMCSDYIGTEIDLNGHKATVSDKSYLDNVMLKKPFTSEDDLDFAISNIFIPPQKLESALSPVGIAKRSSRTDITNLVISGNVKSIEKPLPISLRKRRLLLAKAS